MVDLTVYRLEFKGGIHLGVRGVNLEESAVTLPSDTLFAALVDTFRRAGGAPDAFVAPFPRSSLGRDVAPDAPAPFRLTSTFPFAGGVRFLPMPVPLQRIVSPDELKKRRKAIKRVAFVSEVLFREILDGKVMDDRLFPEPATDAPAGGVALQNGRFWLAAEELDKLPPDFRVREARALHHRRVFAEDQVPRVSIDRVSQASDIFHAGRVCFAQGCGLWFGVDWRRPELPLAGERFERIFERLWHILQDDGLGGERSAGYGAFTLHDGQRLSLPEARAGEPMVLLSRYHPRAAELPAALDTPAAYRLVTVGGWLSSPERPMERRRQLRMLEAGSVVRAVGEAPWGDVVDVRPTYEAADFPHPVWRYGMALGAAIRDAGGVS